MGAAEIELIDVVLAAVVGAFIMLVLILLCRKPAAHDEQVAKYGGIVGIFVYRIGRWLAHIFKRKDA